LPFAPSGRAARRRHRRFPLYANATFAERYYRPERARLRGLAGNPALPADLLRRLVDEHANEVTTALTYRSEWTDDQVAALVSHPSRRIRLVLAEAPGLTPQQRTMLVEDPDTLVLDILAEGPDLFDTWSTDPLPLLTPAGYDRLLERRPEVIRAFGGRRHRWVLPPHIRAALPPERPVPTPPAPLTPDQLAERAADDSEWTRAEVAADPDLPADLVAALAVDPSPQVRLAVSMRPELTEEQRAAIDCHVGPDDRLRPLMWAVRSEDPEVHRRCAYSAHIGLRRSIALNTRIAPDLVARLATDDDHAVRLLLCERNPHVPGEVVLATFLEARVAFPFRLLKHPNFPPARPGPPRRLAGPAHPGAGDAGPRRLARGDRTAQPRPATRRARIGRR
jgi:hypothetical protein